MKPELGNIHLNSLYTPDCKTINSLKLIYKFM